MSTTAILVADFENFPRSYSLLREVDNTLRSLNIRVIRRLGFHFYADKIPAPFEPVTVSYELARRVYGRHYVLAFEKHVNNQLVDTLLIDTTRSILEIEDYDYIVLLASDNHYSILANMRPLIVFSTRIARKLLYVSEKYYLCEKYGKHWICERKK